MPGNAFSLPTLHENVLYVILHGSIILVDVKRDSAEDGFDAYLLDMKTDHRYLYGTWLLESGIPERQPGQDPLILTLDSVEPSQLVAEKNDLNPDLNAVVQLTTSPLPNASAVRALVHLPRPRMIYYFTCGTVDPGSFQGDKTKLVGGKEPSMICGVRVFEYTFPGSLLPVLLPGNPKRPTGSAVWTCPKKLAPVGNRRVATLHIYDEPGTTMTGQAAIKHNLEEFNASMELLEASFKLAKIPHEVRPAPASGNQPTVRTLGILEAEVGALGKRQDVLLDLQYNRRTGQDSAPLGGGGGEICGAANGRVR